jgi:hypothetical protein
VTLQKLPAKKTFRQFSLAIAQSKLTITSYKRSALPRPKTRHSQDLITVYCFGYSNRKWGQIYRLGDNLATKLALNPRILIKLAYFDKLPKTFNII